MRTLLSTVLSLALLTPPLAGQTFQSEVAADLRTVAEKYVSLARAIPEADYDWRPGDGVRSVSEVFMHVSAANLGLPNMLMGVAPPEGYGQAWFGTAEEVTDKDEVVRHLRASFDHLIGVVEGLDDAQLQRSVTVFGRDTNGMGAAMLLQTHTHEHLGQAIAYARTNGIVPPWSS